jgi:hypothetical protein
MASISAARRSIKSELEEPLPESIITDQARAAGHRWRVRKLTPAITVHLFLLQLLAKVSMAGLRQVAGDVPHLPRPRSARRGCA